MFHGKNYHEQSQKTNDKLRKLATYIIGKGLISLKYRGFQMAGGNKHHKNRKKQCGIGKETETQINDTEQGPEIWSRIYDPHNYGQLFSTNYQGNSMG